ncbi:hypothetical protein IG631_24077 [Alternaria alternata]|nr:hypothetical protein IG631_24077 [Alternaria alternata]
MLRKITSWRASGHVTPEIRADEPDRRSLQADGWDHTMPILKQHDSQATEQLEVLGIIDIRSIEDVRAWVEHTVSEWTDLSGVRMPACTTGLETCFTLQYICSLPNGPELVRDHLKETAPSTQAMST